MSNAADHRLLLVHAHPDDETSSTGVTMARSVDQGASVTLVTCTRGEEGQVLVDELAHLAAHEHDQLGHHREEEIRGALAALGVTDWQFLGEHGTYRDSGMMGEAANDRPECFWKADLLEAATRLVGVIRERRPHVMITYDEIGGYGHPDHIQAHRVAMYATMLAAAPTFRADLGDPWDIPKIYWTGLPRSLMRAGVEWMRENQPDSDWAQIDPETIEFGCPDELLTTRIVGLDYMDQKVAAMRCYPTQIDLTNSFFTMALWPDSPMAREYFRLVKGTLGPVDADGFEDDLFAGIAGGQATQTGPGASG